MFHVCPANNMRVAPTPHENKQTPTSQGAQLRSRVRHVLETEIQIRHGAGHESMRGAKTMTAVMALAHGSARDKPAAPLATSSWATRPVSTLRAGADAS
ncbi:unnamed protein product, partial [Pylaiella littoralis]